MTVFISVVSHGHCDLIKELSCLSSLAENFHVVVKSNKPNDIFEELSQEFNFHWLDKQYGCGFGQNNNIVFNYCRSKLCMTDDDYFIVLNPDVVVAADDIRQLVKMMHEDQVQLSAINLFKDKELTTYDNSIRNFPSLGQFVSSFLGQGNSSIINKNTLKNSCHVDWAAGSFLAFKSEHYAKLGGFDENYFMYCEDIDICYRSFRLDIPITYYPYIKALHLANHANRNLLSKHFYWHVTSVIRFLLTKINLTNPKSSITSSKFQ